MENADADAPNIIGTMARHLRCGWFFQLSAPILRPSHYRRMEVGISGWRYIIALRPIKSRSYCRLSKIVSVIALCLCYASAVCSTSTRFQYHLHQHEFLHCRLHCRLLVPLKDLDADNQGGAHSGLRSNRGPCPD